MSDLPPPGDEPEQEWPDGKGSASFRNVCTALTALGYTFHFNRRARRALIGVLDKAARKTIDESTLTRLRREIIDAFGFDPKKDNLTDAVMALAYEDKFDPVCKYLDGLNWDGRRRLKNWLWTYLGVKNTAFTRAVATIVLVAAVRRARRPGCRFDEVLVLVGPQGSGKSRAVYILALRASWFSDQELLHLSAQQQQEALDGVWIYELSELGGLGKASVERVKAFASRRSDRARRAYGRFREDVKRMCVFIATTNDDLFLRDPTGNRRFWPVNVGRVRLKQLRADIHQLWAEAAHLEASGYKTTLPKRLWKAAARAQNRRMEQHGWVATLAELEGEVHGDELRISYAEIFKKLGLPASQRTTENMNRINLCMVHNGWRRRSKPFKFNGKTCRGFTKPLPD